MGNFQGGNRGGGGFRGGNSGGRPSFQKKSWGGSGDRGETVMHKAVCDECHKNCEVPFRPSGDKPVYCSDCFGSKRDDGNRAPRKEFGNREPRKEFTEKTNSFAKPQAPSNDDTKKFLIDISTKLDRLAVAIEKLSQMKPEVTTVKAAPVAKMEVKKAVVSKPVVKVVAAPKKVIAVKAKVAAKSPAKKVVSKKK